MRSADSDCSFTSVAPPCPPCLRGEFMTSSSSSVYDQAELYCIAFGWPVDDEVDWLLGRCPGARSVLEPCCGQARFAAAFVERGLAYFGVDRSEGMLARAPAARGSRSSAPT